MPLSKKISFILCLISIAILSSACPSFILKKFAPNKKESTSVKPVIEIQKIKKLGKHWTNSKEKGRIPNTPITGTLNGKSFEIKSIYIKQWGKKFAWTFSHAASQNNKPCSSDFKADKINFREVEIFEGSFNAAMEDKKDFSDHHAYYVYVQEDDTLMSVNTSWESKIVVDKIDRAAKKVTGWAQIKFSDGKTAIQGSFVADMCSWK